MLETTPAVIPEALLAPAEKTEYRWESGRWSAVLRAGSLDELRVDGEPVLRALRCVIRESDWGTPIPEITLTEEGRTLVIHAMIGTAIEWVLRVDADEDLTATALIRIHEPSALNRAGLVILHHQDLAGVPLTVRHSDSAEGSTAFPRQISPHQPVMDITGLSWAGIDLEVQGDIWEMEDQRNWTDGSFKTYSTPLAIPFPVHHPAGTVITHRISLQAARRGIPAAPIAEPKDSVVVGSLTSAIIPQITHGGIQEWDAADSELAARVHSLAGEGLDIRLIADTAQQVTAAGALLSTLGDRLVRAGVYDRGSSLATAELIAALRASLPAHVDLVGGTRAHFTELNRGRAELNAQVDELGFSLIPFMHEVSGYQLWDSIAAQVSVRESARALAPETALRIGPVTLHARFNAVAEEREGEAPERDPREDAPELASWLLASVAALSGPGVVGLDYALGSSPAIEQLIAALAAQAGQRIAAVDSTIPEIFGFATEEGTLFLGNRGALARTVRVGEMPVDLAPGQVRELRR